MSTRKMSITKADLLLLLEIGILQGHYYSVDPKTIVRWIALLKEMGGELAMEEGNARPETP